MSLGYDPYEKFGLDWIRKGEELYRQRRIAQGLPDHEHCFHAFHGALLMVIPDGHVVQKCCKCSATRTIHVDHVHDHRSTDGW
jgi:hypothetical protein